MRVMVLVKATIDSEAGVLPSPELFAQMGAFNAALAAAGILKAGEGLRPSSAGKRVVFENGERRVADGPFANPTELVAGFWLWEVKDMEEAMDWARRCPNPMPPGRGAIEIRPLYELADFADALPPDGAARETRLRDDLSGT